MEENQITNQREISLIKKGIAAIEHYITVYFTKRAIKKGSMFVLQDEDQEYFNVEIDNSKLATWVFNRIKKTYEEGNPEKIHKYLLALVEEAD